MTRLSHEIDIPWVTVLTGQDGLAVNTPDFWYGDMWFKSEPSPYSGFSFLLLPLYNHILGCRANPSELKHRVLFEDIAGFSKETTDLMLRTQDGDSRFRRNVGATFKYVLCTLSHHDANACIFHYFH
jgi:hypothetical protein